MTIKLEDIKTENDARQALVEKILDVAYVYHSSEFNGGHVLLELIKYIRLRDQIRDGFNIDTTPYDKVISGYTKEGNVEYIEKHFIH